MKACYKTLASPIAFLAAMAASETTLGKAAHTDFVCPDRWGKPGRPLVERAETAKGIFIAVESEFKPDADKRGFPDVDAEDDGASWVVSRWRLPIQRPDETITATTGRGQLSLRIAKCNGAISDVWLSR